MCLRKTCVVLVGTSLGLLQSHARAQEPPATPAQPLMRGLHALGLEQPLSERNVKFYGFAEGSYTYGFDRSPDRLLPGRIFDFQGDQLMLNQFDLSIERAVDLKTWDVGGKIEMIYGQDAGLIHSNGLFDGFPRTRATGATKNSPENQFDLVQAYADFAIPIGNGLDVRAGKWVSLLGYETINPTTTPLYSRSYLFGYAVPFAHTGVLATYVLDDHWTFAGGVTRGWDQSLEDNNDALDVTGQIKYTRDALGLAFTFISGPEQTDDNDDWRTVIDIIATYKVSDQLTLALNGDYGWETAVAGNDVSWYGVAGYASYAISPRYTLNARAEWFDDADGTRTGISTDFYELTLGVAIKPFANDSIGENLILRPEIRFDYADDDAFDGGTKRSQTTIGIDVIFNF